MAFWRMQLHPNESAEAVRHTVTSLAASLIGLDFGPGSGPTAAAADVGDLIGVDRGALLESQRAYLPFATEMKEGDHVLVIVHNFPFALCRVAGGYKYVREVSLESGIWFRHSRRVDDVRYYGDFVKDAHAWERTLMPHAFGPLLDPESAQYKLIWRWLGAAQQ